MADEWNPIGMLIRTTRRNGFRYGHPHPWGIVQGFERCKGRACYRVWFPQGDVTDWWPVIDANDLYEFRSRGGGNEQGATRDD